MDLLVFGISHNTAPVEIREKFSFRTKNSQGVNFLLKGQAGLKESLILSTCNRVEIYCLAESSLNVLSEIAKFLSNFHGLDFELYKERFYCYRGVEAAEHLFKVASGLDSMVFGENEIMGQVKRAFEQARLDRGAGKVLNKLFERALSTAKKVRAQTFIGEGAVSVSSAAARMAKKILGRLDDKNILVIGAGKVGEKLVVYLKEEGVDRICVTNRTFARACMLAEKFNASAVSFADFKLGLKDFDIIITSAGAPHYLISQSDILPVMAQRKLRPLFIIDLAVPRDVEPQVGVISNVHLYDIDDLQKTVEQAVQLRRAEAGKCLEIIWQSARYFAEWLERENLKSEEEFLYSGLAR